MKRFAFIEPAVVSEITARIVRMYRHSRSLRSHAIDGRKLQEERGITSHLESGNFEKVPSWLQRDFVPRPKTEKHFVRRGKRPSKLRMILRAVATNNKYHKEYLPSVYLRYTLNKEGGLDYFLKKYGVTKVKSNLFASPEFKKWFTVVKEAYEPKVDLAYDAMVQRLKAKFGKDKVYEELALASKVSETRETSMVLDDALLRQWLDMGVSRLLSHEEFKKWFSYRTDEIDALERVLRSMNKKHVRHELNVMLDLARRTDVDAAIIAADLELTAWKVEGLTANEMFEKLKLHTITNEKLFNSVELYAWYHFVSRIEGAPDDLLLSKLLGKSTAEDLAELLLMAEKNYKGNFVAKNLYDTLLNKWDALNPDKATRAKPPAFKGTGADIFDSAEMSVWATNLSKQYEDDDWYRVMLIELQKIYKEELPKMIAQGERNGNVVAKNLAYLARSGDV